MGHRRSRLRVALRTGLLRQRPDRPDLRSGLEPSSGPLGSLPHVKRSAGLLVWRRTDGDDPAAVEVLLAHPGGPLFVRKDDGCWSIPKGELDGDEEPLAAANREFAEEIGVAPPASDPVSLGEAKQRGGKVNLIWAVEGDLEVNEVRSNLFPMEWPPHSGRIQEFPEVDRAGWFPVGEARQKLFASQEVFLDRLVALVGGAQS